MIDLQLYEYVLPLKRPFRIGKTDMKCRRGFLICTFDGRFCGWGEASPLPGFSVDTSQDVLDQFHQFLSKGIANNENDWQRFLQIKEITAVSSPALRFGVESALIDLRASQQGLTPAILLGGNCEKIPNNGLAYGDSAGELVRQAARLAEEGYRVIKIKVGRLALADEIAAIKEIAAFNLQLRLDANRLLPLDQAVDFARAVADLPIEYIEEPVDDPRDLPEFSRFSPIAPALDESLLMPEGEHLAAAAWILKPGIHGGIKDLIACIARARERGILPVISSPLLSAVGLRTAAAVAAAFCPDTVMGLDTASLLDRDFLSRPIDTKGGVLKLPELENSFHVNESELTCPASSR
ncbi:MAG: o-succinylbenzoate synthase [candidate division KSB1 bacterium]|nr:o-succinylbenzoate synthase [candidate division KSB1 bacterium]